MTQSATGGPDKYELTESDAAREALRFFAPALADLPYGPALVGALLTGSAPEQKITIPSSDVYDLVARLRYHRLEPQFIEALGRDHLDLQADDRTWVLQHAAMLALYGLDLEHLLVTVGGILDSIGVDFLVLKGMATRQLDHPSGTLRQAADVDLLVPASAYMEASNALSEAGFRRPDEAATLMDKGGAWRTESGRSVDLHTRPHTAGRDLTDYWWATSDTFEVAGHPFRALSRGGRLAHAASHIALSFPNHRILSSFYDLIAIAGSATRGDVVEAERFLNEVGVSDIVWRITSRAQPFLDDRAVVLGSRKTGSLEWLLQRAYDRSDLDKVAVKLAKVYGMPWSGRRRVFNNWLFPSTGYLEAGGYRSRLDRLTSVATRQWRPTNQE